MLNESLGIGVIKNMYIGKAVYKKILSCRL